MNFLGNLLSFIPGPAKLWAYGLGALMIIGAIGTLLYQYHYGPIRLLNKEINSQKEVIDAVKLKNKFLMQSLHNKEAELKKCETEIEIMKFESENGVLADDLNDEINDIGNIHDNSDTFTF